MKPATKKAGSEPTQPAALIILGSVIISGLISKLVFTALEVTPLFRGAFALVWILLTALYLRQTGNGRVARNYLIVMLSILLFIGLAIAFYDK